LSAVAAVVRPIICFNFASAGPIFAAYFDKIFYGLIANSGFIPFFMSAEKILFLSLVSSSGPVS
jgi:hypothetical protein